MLKNKIEKKKQDKLLRMGDLNRGSKNSADFSKDSEDSEDSEDSDNSQFQESVLDQEDGE